jgi:hypothetical protein
MLRPVKDKLGLKVTSMYCVPCEYGEVYIGQTGRSIKTGCKVHMRCICLGQPEKSAVAEHKSETGHNINFNRISIPDNAIGYMNHVTKEVTEINLHPSNFDGDSGFTLSQSWYLVMNTVKQFKDTPTQK